MENRTKTILKPFEADAAYFNERVASGIEKNRKGWAKIQLIDREGNPVSDVHVHATQKTHEFKYGANLFLLDELESEEKNAAYRELFADAFNFATLPFYWCDLEPEQGKPRYAKESPRIYRRPTPDLCLEYCEKKALPRKHIVWTTNSGRPCGFRKMWIASNTILINAWRNFRSVMPDVSTGGK